MAYTHFTSVLHFFPFRTRWYPYLLLLVVASLLNACTSSRQVQLRAYLEKSHCNQLNQYQYSVAELPRPLHELQLDTILTNNYSVNSLNIANAIGALDLLEQYTRAKREYTGSPSDANLLQMLYLSDRLQARINNTTLEVSASASEMDCEEERTDQVAQYLTIKENNRETRLTVGALITGAATAVVSGILLLDQENSDAAEIAGISGGLAEVLFASTILLSGRKVEFYHPRNPLREVWEGKETSTIFPPSIWYYLLYKNPSVADEKSLRERIIETWTGFGQLADTSDSKARTRDAIYFGEGGKYTAEQLINRANMHDQLESHINLMNQDLRQLTAELERF